MPTRPKEQTRNSPGSPQHATTSNIRCEDLSEGFVPKGKIEIYAGFKLEGPIYIARLKPGEGTKHPSCIDLSLAIEPPSGELKYSGKPSYTEFTPQLRYLYLGWLSSGAKSPAPKYFPLLYLIGLERYVLTRPSTGLKNTEFKNLQAISIEISRLKRIQGYDSGQFASRSSSLLDLIYIRFWPEKIQDRLKEYPQSDLASRYAAATLSKLKSDSDKIDVVLHRFILGGSPEKKTALKRSYPLMRELFTRLLLERLPSKPFFSTSHKSLVLSYKPSNSRQAISYKIDGLRDCWDLLENERLIQEVFDQSLEASIVLAKLIEKGALVDVIAYWPESLPYRVVPNVDKLRNNTLALLRSSTGFNIEALLALFKMPNQRKLTKTEFSKIQRAVEKLGFFLVPDIRLTPEKLDRRSKVVAASGKAPEELSPPTMSLCLEIRLSKELAWAGGVFRPDRFSELPTKIKEIPDVFERDYAMAYFQWMTTASPSKAGLSQQISSVGPGEHYQIIRSLVERSLAHGQLAPSEVQFLETVFVKHFKLPAGDFFGVLNNLAAGPSNINPVPVTGSKEQGNSNLRLDPTKLAFHKASTFEAQKTLHEVLEDPTVEEDSLPAPQNDTPPQFWYSERLNGAESELLRWIMSSTSWPLKEVESKCEELGLMTTGALESINEASLDEFGEGLIDIADPIIVYTDIFEMT